MNSVVLWSGVLVLAVAAPAVAAQAPGRGLDETDGVAAQRMFEDITGGFGEMVRLGGLGEPLYLLYTKPVKVMGAMCQGLVVRIGDSGELGRPGDRIISTDSYFFLAPSSGECRGPVSRLTLQYAPDRGTADERYRLARRLVTAAAGAGPLPFTLRFSCEHGRDCLTPAATRALLARLDPTALTGGRQVRPQRGAGYETVFFKARAERDDVAAVVRRDQAGAIVRVELGMASRIRF